MKYRCGHEGCDVCGSRECAGTTLWRYGDVKACYGCIEKAIRLAIRATEEFSTHIDLSKPCCSLSKERNKDNAAL